MKPNNFIIGAQIFLAILFIYFLQPDLFINSRISPPAIAQTPSMPGMPGMPAEKPQDKAPSVAEPKMIEEAPTSKSPQRSSN